MIGRSVFCTLIGMAVLFAALFPAPRLDAQVLYGSIVGTVTDQGARRYPTPRCALPAAAQHSREKR